MRVLSGFLAFFGAVFLYFGLGMFALFSGEADTTAAILIKGSLVPIAELLLCAAGWAWFRAKQSDLSVYEPEKALAQSRRQIRQRLAKHLVVFSSGGLLVVILVLVAILAR